MDVDPLSAIGEELRDEGYHVEFFGIAIGIIAGDGRRWMAAVLGDEIVLISCGEGREENHISLQDGGFLEKLVAKIGKP